MYDISDITTEDITSGTFIRPVRVHYKQNGIEKKWEIIQSCNSVSVLIHNITRGVFVGLLVKQFRPPVYMNMAHSAGLEGGVVDSSIVSPQKAFTLELCGGKVDKVKSLEQIAAEEVLEDCGYRIEPSSLDRIVACRTNVGTSGTQHTMFYARVGDEMKVGGGGGVPEEGEMVEILEVPVASCLEHVMGQENEKSMGLFLALMWFLKNKQ